MTSEADPTDLKRSDSGSPTLSANTDVTTPSPTQPANNLLDDVFGSSEPASPVAAQPNADVTGSEARATADLAEHKDSADITRLRSIHSTSGYRDGLAVARERVLQSGFDEGYSLGAALGLKAGLVVGSFESLRNAVKGEKNGRVRGQLEAITKGCIKDLSRDNLFSTEYLDLDGTWKWDAPADGSLHDVAAAHPVVKMWLIKLDNVLQRLGVGPEKLEIRWTDHAVAETDELLKQSKLPSARNNPGQSGQVFEI